MRTQYKVFNSAQVTTAAPVKITTGTSIKTLLQLATPSTTELRIVEWGIDFDGSPVAGQVSLIQTDVAATVTAYGASDIIQTNDPATPAASKVTLGTSASGFTASAEGTVAATRLIDSRILTTNSYSRPWALGTEPRIAVSKFLRIRVTFAAAVNATCWVEWCED